MIHLKDIVKLKISHSFFTGVGYGMVIISTIVCVYYNIIITWTLYYLFMSMRAMLPWASCDNDWNTENCVLKRDVYQNETGMLNETYYTAGAGKYLSQALNNSTVNVTALLGNASQSLLHLNKTKTASEEFWQ